MAAQAAGRRGWVGSRVSAVLGRAAYPGGGLPVGKCAMVASGWPAMVLGPGWTGVAEAPRSPPYE